jgi:hypothetical protein
MLTPATAPGRAGPHPAVQRLRNAIEYARKTMGVEVGEVGDRKRVRQGRTVPQSLRSFLFCERYVKRILQGQVRV